MESTVYYLHHGVINGCHEKEIEIVKLCVHAVATEALLYRGGCQLPSSPSKLSIRAVSGEAMSEKRNLSRTVSFLCSRNL